LTDPERSHVIPRASLADAVYERLRNEIMAGGIADGSKLSQVQLAKRYGVSRIPVREALRRLQAESLVIATPFYPFVVRNVTPAQVMELVDVRAALEDLALSSRAPLAAKELAELRRMNASMARDRDGAGFLDMDRAFHHLIAGPGTMTVEILDDVRSKVHKYMSSMVSAKPRRATATEEHALIIEALENQDMDLARRRMHDHVMASRAYIASRITADGTARAAAVVTDVERVEA